MNWKWRVVCRVCGWKGYRVTGTWAKGESPMKRVHPDACPSCRTKGYVVGLFPKVTK